MVLQNLHSLPYSPSYDIYIFRVRTPLKGLMYESDTLFTQINRHLCSFTLLTSVILTCDEQQLGKSNK